MLDGQNLQGIMPDDGIANLSVGFHRAQDGLVLRQSLDLGLGLRALSLENRMRRVEGLAQLTSLGLFALTQHEGHSIAKWEM